MCSSKPGSGQWWSLTPSPPGSQWAGTLATRAPAAFGPLQRTRIWFWARPGCVPVVYSTPQPFRCTLVGGPATSLLLLSWPVAQGSLTHFMGIVEQQGVMEPKSVPGPGCQGEVRTALTAAPFQVPSLPWPPAGPGSRGLASPLYFSSLVCDRVPPGRTFLQR